MSRPTVYLDSLGCEKNLVDSQSALGLLLQSGFSFVDAPRGADLIVVNTCGFLASARTESLERIHELAAEKGEGTLVVMGCFVQGGSHDIRALIPEVDHLLGVGQYDQLSGLLKDHAQAGPLGSPDEAPYAGYGARVLTGATHVAHLKIAEGCNQRCAFCKIPNLRGRQRSRPVADLMAEAAQLVGQGARELILIAQNSSAYGIDLPGRPRLARLCAELAQLDGLDWIRVMYAYPPMLTDALLNELFSVDKVVNYLDLPIQHASPRVLDAMDRGYDPSRLRRQIDRLRRARPGIMLRSTALLGFPGETEDDVVALLDFLAEIQFDHLGTFVYSHEEGTPAFPRRDDVDSSEKEDRRARVEDLQADIAWERKTGLLGKKLEIVIDEVRVEPDGLPDELAATPDVRGIDLRKRWTGKPIAFGRSEGFCHEIDGGLWLDADGSQPGDILTVEVAGAGPFDLLAQRTSAAAAEAKGNR